jgi:hypothetical protein
MKTISVETKDGRIEMTFEIKDSDYQKFLDFLKNEGVGFHLFQVHSLTVVINKKEFQIILMEEKV